MRARALRLLSIAGVREGETITTTMRHFPEQKAVRHFYSRLINLVGPRWQILALNPANRENERNASAGCR